MKQSDIEKVLNILDLTSSKYDGEALTAVRKANEILEANGMRWGQFFISVRDLGPAGPNGSQGADVRYQRSRRGQMSRSEIGDIFNVIDQYCHLLSQNQAKWVDRMTTAWEASDSLSKRQEEIITNIRDELRDKAQRGGGL